MHPAKWTNVGSDEELSGSCNGRVFCTITEITETTYNGQDCYCYYVVYLFGTFGDKYCYDLLQTVTADAEKEFNDWRDNNKVFFEEDKK